MKKVLLAIVATCVLLTTVPANAQTPVTCVNCSTLAEQVLQYARQLLQLNEETQTEIEETFNTANLTATAFNDLYGIVVQLMAIADEANMLQGLAGKMMTNIRTPGGYPIGYGQGILAWHQQVTDEANAVGLGLNSAAQALNALQTLVKDVGQMEILVSQIMAYPGREKALQTIGSELAQMTQTLQRTQATQTTNQQAELTYLMGQQDRQYLFHTVNDHDLEGAWVSQCNDITALGGAKPADC